MTTTTKTRAADRGRQGEISRAGAGARTVRGGADNDIDSNGDEADPFKAAKPASEARRGRRRRGSHSGEEDTSGDDGDEDPFKHRTARLALRPERSLRVFVTKTIAQEKRQNHRITS